MMFNHPHRFIAGAAAAAALLLAVAAPAARAQQVGDVFYIAMENHNWTQPSSLNAAINPIFGDTAAAPYINSLVTPGNANAAQVSYATSYYNAGTAEHPSEPNYVWAEAGTNFNPTTPNVAGGGTSTSANSGPTNTTQGIINGTTILNDNDSGATSGNIFPTTFAANHLTGQINAAGISWKNYQEDYQISGNGPTHSASGTTGPVNPYNGSTQYNYAEKHNPMAYFADTATQNVAQMSQLTTDLTNNTVGRYNWITPDQYNDMHTALTAGFTYNGQHFTGDQAQIAQGDNYLSIIIPQIMASQAYKNNGAIVIWNDETEGGDTTAETSMEIVISPLAKGNAYASNVVMNHSSDIKTMEELFGLSQINNPIPTSETFAAGGYATVQGANDLSDMLVPGALTSVPEPTSLGLVGAGAIALLGRRRRKA
jgi:hypothetical protein